MLSDCILYTLPAVLVVNLTPAPHIPCLSADSQIAAPVLLHPKPAHLEAQRVQLEQELARLADQESDLHQACNALTSQLQLAVADTQAAEQDAQAAKQRLQAQLAMWVCPGAGRVVQCVRTGTVCTQIIARF